MAGIGNKSDVPSFVFKYFSDVDCSNPEVSPVHCAGCKSIASVCLEAKEGYYPGECLIMTCYNRNCKETNWAYCKTCKARILAKWAKKKHSVSAKHQKNANVRVNDLISDAMISSPESSPSGNSKKRSHSEIMEDDNYVNNGGISDVIVGNSDSNVTVDKPDFAEVCAPIYPKSEAIKCGNEWIQDHVRGQSIASMTEVNEVFRDNENMKFFYVAEHQTPAGRCGGGIRYLVARAFMGTELIEAWKMPSLEEAKYHFEAFVQYQSMNEKQRRRNMKLVQYLDLGREKLFTTTHIPTDSDIEQIYGRQGSHSLWNTLPIPNFRNLSGIAMVELEEIIKYLFANAIPVENMKALNALKRTERAIVTVSESNAADKFLDEICKSPASKNLIPLWGVTWRDGFGPSRTKNNQNSVVLWTITFAPPKEMINATSNTFLLALGSKKNPNWPEVEKEVYTGLKRISNASKPITVYSLATKTTLQVCFGQFAALEDKVERADATATIAYSSDYHRCFGKIIKVETAKCNITALEEYQTMEKEAANVNEKKWGWSNQFIENSPKKNGGFLPACNLCRHRRLQLLGVSVPGKPDEICGCCANWQLLEHETHVPGLRFSLPADYPTHANSGCPVAAPAGREVPPNKDGLDIIAKLMNEYLKASVRFAYYNSRVRKNKQTGHRPWTKSNCAAYLRTCGVAKKVYDLVYECAKAKRGIIEQVDYFCDNGVGNYEFSPAWNSDLPVHLHIELLMHQLFLGVAEDNFELSDEWFKKASQGTATFRNRIQPLLRFLSTFHLSWCLIHPFSGVKGSYKTGSWVSENWLAWTRISKFVYVFAARDGSRSQRNGCNDLLRMHIAYVAVVARLLTHFGITQHFIRLTDEYIKEFLSCVHELDIRIRPKFINGKRSQTNQQASENASNKKSKKTKSTYGYWWMKSNYFSMFNLAPTMIWLGPLVNFWDGGGKGERFIQEVKPYIPRGIPVNSKTYFVRLSEKVYKMQTLSRMERLFINEENFEGDRENLSADSDSEDDVSLPTQDEADSVAVQSEEEEADDSMEVEGDKSSEVEVVMEIDDHHMKKAGTMYVYRRKQQLLDSIQNNLPLTGIVLKDKEGNNTLLAVFRNGRKSYSWMEIKFDDSNGESLYGLWYAPLSCVETSEKIPQSIDEIKGASDMSVLALPLHYVTDDPSLANKYCAITNWWTERTEKNTYVMPTLDESLYGGEPPIVTLQHDEKEEGVDYSLVI
jgi:hypothetical protein